MKMWDFTGCGQYTQFLSRMITQNDISHFQNFEVSPKLIHHITLQSVLGLSQFFVPLAASMLDASFCYVIYRSKIRRYPRSD
jgi:Gpi18-like mannosyltransferase